MFKSGGPRECLLLFDDPKAATLASFLDETEFADRKIKVRREALPPPPRRGRWTCA